MALYRGYRFGWLTTDAAAQLGSAEAQVAYVLERLHAPLGTRWTPNQDTAINYAQGKRSEKWCNYWRRPYIDRYVITGAVLELPETAFSSDVLTAARLAGREDARGRYTDDGSYAFAEGVTAWPPSSAFLQIDGPGGPANFDVTAGLPDDINGLERIVDNVRPTAIRDWDHRCRRCRHRGARSAFGVEGVDPICPTCGATEIDSGEGWPWGDRSKRDWYHPRWMIRQDQEDLFARYADRNQDEVRALYEKKASAALPDWKSDLSGRWLDIVNEVAAELDINRSVVERWVSVRRSV